ncbi:hypothetical protein ACFLTZ_06290 [Chloroflexota bacterium]
MIILDKIKSFLKRAKPVAEVAKRKPPEATIQKPAKTTQPQKEAPKGTGKKVPRARKRKRAG